jgi:hypothetical protein
MYTVTIYYRPMNDIRTFEFNNIREALNSFIDRCDALGYSYEEDNEGNFIAGGLGHDYTIELNSNF